MKFKSTWVGSAFLLTWCAIAIAQTPSSPTGNQTTVVNETQVNDGFGGFNWSAVIDNDPASGTFNPVPLVADGSTPIGASLMDAFDWYVEQREPGGRWENDPLAECRKWYVVLITDGADT